MQDFIPASEKQVNFMWSLVAEREFASEELEAEFENEISDGVDKRRASALIKYMLGLPRRAAVAPSASNSDPVTETAASSPTTTAPTTQAEAGASSASTGSSSGLLVAIAVAAALGAGVLGWVGWRSR